jgi:hypothetical protein
VAVRHPAQTVLGAPSAVGSTSGAIPEAIGDAGVVVLEGNIDALRMHWQWF